MRKKTNNTPKKRFFKVMLEYAIIQCVILLLFLSMWNDSKPLDRYELKTSTVTVEDTRYRKFRGGSAFSIYVDSIEYRFPDSNKSCDFLARELNDLIQTGDTITITYKPWRGTRKWVVDARTDFQAYVSIEGYDADSRSQRICSVLVFGFLELLLLFCLCTYFILGRTELKQMFKYRKKGKRRKRKRQKEDRILGYDEQLYSSFVALSLQQCMQNDYVNRQKVKAHNDASEELKKLEAKIKKTDREKLLCALLAHEDDRVKINAASFCLRTNVLVNEAIRVLKRVRNTSTDSTICFSAKMLLKGANGE